MSREDVRVVGVEVLVDVEDEVGDAAVGVGDLRKSVGRAVRDDSLDRSSVISGEARCSVRLHCGRLSVHVIDRCKVHRTYPAWRIAVTAA